ncbi:hypothetical protein L202_03705 [Cryptococcus amylolentus CBS 6039]|uniref:Uncharacterized protein n=2 Tax=Cryptococcus amylolentus TaxID=104669 RepID=A0A1E3HVN5_9TREE|nr:hypothetical protein L202_03705 [Cryptococcus amylolentus CBS 6039]ODN79806.1 hypothetical protein L202_03705 [Cryptococcus amylolentus CBS 6039]ODO08081.1 hypothetical protein I350_03664 [Cryptococcus amylolentus CBS 6273]
MARPRSASINSTSTYAPILINPLPTPTPPLPSQNSSRRPSLRYAYPLVLIALLDCLHIAQYLLGTSAKHHASLPAYITTAAFARAALCSAVAFTRKWRTRGGWIGASSGISLTVATWEECRRVLVRGDNGHGDETTVDGDLTCFLGIFGGFAVCEYLLFLLLLRISPPPYKTNPLALRLPQTHTQSPMPFGFASERATVTPGSFRDRVRGHVRGESGISEWTSEGGGGGQEEDDVFGGVYNDDSDEEESSLQNEDYFPGLSGERHPSRSTYTHCRHRSSSSQTDSGAGEDDEEDADDSASSISSSSIIDLPPARSPSALTLALPILPPSLGGGYRWGAAAGEGSIGRSVSSPNAGPFVRKRSGFLGRSWGSGRSTGTGASEACAVGQGEIDSGQGRGTNGYGTFGP